MEYIPIIKDILAMIVLPLIWQVRVLLLKQKELVAQLSGVSSMLKEIDVSLEEAEHDRAETKEQVSKLISKHRIETTAIFHKIVSIDSKLDMILNQLFKK